MVLVDSVDMDGSIVAGTQSFDIEFNRSDPIMLTGGAGVKLWGVHWFTDISLIGEEYVRLGAAWIF